MEKVRTSFKPIVERIRKTTKRNNKQKLSNQLIERQNRILTRLLESAKAVKKEVSMRKENQKKEILKIIVTKLDLMSILMKKRNKLNY